MASGANANPNKVKNFPLVPFLAGLGIVSSILFYQYQRYGMSLFVDRSSFDSSYSASEWHGILSNKTLLLIGGPHRGGTTVLWKALDAHPDISGLGTEPPAEDGVMMLFRSANVGKASSSRMYTLVEESEWNT